MNFRRTSMFVLCGLLSFDSLATLPTVRTSAVRLGQVSPSSGNQNASRASINKLPGRTHTGVTNNKVPQANKPGVGIQDEIQQLRDAVSQQLTSHRQEIDELRAAIAEKDKVIANLESSLEDYEEIKATVKNMPTTIRNEIDSRRLATVDSLNTVQQQVQQNAAKFNDYATKSQVENLELGTDVDEVKQIITTQLAANKVVTESDLNDVSAEVAAVRTSVQNEAQARTRAIADLESSVGSEVNAVRTLAQSNSEKFANYATKEQLENLEVGTDENRVKEIITAQLNENNVVTQGDLNAFAKLADVQEISNKISTIETNADEQTAIIAAMPDTILNMTYERHIKGLMESNSLTQQELQTALANLRSNAERDEQYAEQYADLIAALEARVVTVEGGIPLLITRVDTIDDTLPTLAKAEDLTAVSTRIDGMSQDMAGTLLQDKAFMDGVLAAAGENVEELIDTVDTLDGKIKVIEGANYLKTADLRQAVTELDLPTGTDENRVKEIITAQLNENNVVTQGDLSDYAKSTDLRVVETG